MRRFGLAIRPPRRLYQDHVAAASGQGKQGSVELRTKIGDTKPTRCLKQSLACGAFHYFVDVLGGDAGGGGAKERVDQLASTGRVRQGYVEPFHESIRFLTRKATDSKKRRRGV